FRILFCQSLLVTARCESPCASIYCFHARRRRDEEDTLIRWRRFPRGGNQHRSGSAMKDTLGVLLAGGAGERLYPLTRDRAKPAVTLAGSIALLTSPSPTASIPICAGFTFLRSTKLSR